MSHPENKYVEMPTFSEGSASSLAIRSLDIEGKNTVNEESLKEVEETRSESIEKESSSWDLNSVLTYRDLAERVGARLEKRNETTKALAKGYIVVFKSQLKLRLRWRV